MKILLNKKKIAFREGNISELNVLQREIKCEISRAKLNYKEMLERKLSQNNLGSAWDGLRTITVSIKKCKSRVALSGAKSDKQLAQDLNEFYLRFDTLDFSNMNSKLKNELPCTGSPPFNECSVIESFKRTKSEKAQVLCGRLLHSCAEQLGPIFFYIFQMSLNQQRVPRSWKDSTIVPVAKTKHPKVLNDFRPVALTSLVMKSFERLMKEELLPHLEPLLDPLQFAYRASRGVEDATATLLNLVFKHLESSKTHARLLFVDFSSAFNTIQPHILIDKLVNNFNLDFNVVGWILDFF